MVILVVPIIISGFSTDDFLLVTDSNSEDLFQYNLNTNEVSLILVKIDSHTVAIAYHHLEQKLYWTDAEAEVLQRASLDGTGQEVLLSLPAGQHTTHLYGVPKLNLMPIF